NETLPNVVHSSVNSRNNAINGSPTRVSGIFRPNSPKNNKSNESQPKRSMFMTGLEKKVVEDVKKGSLDPKKARKVLNEMKNSFKSPLKTKGGTDCKKSETEMDPNLKNIDPNLIEVIENEIITALEPIQWSDVAGLEFAKNKIREIA